jgi:hypothetical protein
MLVVNGVVLYQGIPLKFHGTFLVQDFYECNAMKTVYKGVLSWGMTVHKFIFPTHTTHLFNLLMLGFTVLWKEPGQKV